MTSVETPRRVLVRAPNWLGDAVLALPAIVAVRRRFPEAHLTIAAPGPLAALYGEAPEVAPDAVLELSDRRREAIRALGAGQFDLGILFPNSFDSAWQLRRAGIRARWGYRTAGRAWLLTKTAPVRRGVHHHADYFRALVGGLDIPGGDEPPRLVPSAPARAEAGRLLERVAGRRLVGLAPGAAYGEAKQWPADRLAQLAARLVRDHEVTCLVLGAAHDQAAARAIESWLRVHEPAAGPHVLNFVGRTSLRGLVGVLASCQVVVSNDSGAMHVAAGVGRPVVAIFGPTDERSTRPIGDDDVITHSVFCRPCLLRDCPIDHRCMTRITVDEVAAATARRLAGPAPAGLTA